MACIGGTVKVVIDGVSYEVGESVSYSDQEWVNETKVGHSGARHHTRKRRAPFVEFELLTTSELSMQDLDDLQDATVVVDLANGRSLTYPNARKVGESDWDATEGTGTVRFESDLCVAS